MRRFFAAAFSTAFLDLELLQSDALFDSDDTNAENAWRIDVAEKLQGMAEECTHAGFSDLAHRCTNLALQASDRPVMTLCYMLRDILPAIQYEITKHKYFLVPEERKGLYHEDDRPLFGDDVSTVFSSVSPEIAEAGRCLALARWTACVFHLMRALEQALHKWAVNDMGVTLSTPPELINWQQIINEAGKHLKSLGQLSKNQQRQDDLQYFGETLSRFQGIKEAWRNHVSHGHKTYDEREALSIWGQVKDFMQHLSKRP